MQTSDSARFSFLDAPALRAVLEDMGQAMARRREWVEIAIFGGSALLLHLASRPSTRDVDYIPVSGDSAGLAKVAQEVGARHGLPEGWLNDAVGMFVEELRDHHPFEVYPRESVDGGLRVLLASPRYILAMKIRAMRSALESNDVSDIWELLGHCGIGDADEALSLVRKFFPDLQLMERNKAILRDIVDARNAGRPFDPMVGW